jgi:cytosine/adenosine deaminase-related metal-dependent hydrolase
VLQTVLAHGVYLSDEELDVLAAHGSSVSHCPNSNTSLRSGLCDVRRLLNADIKVGLGTGMIHYTDMRHLTVGIHSEKCIAR